MGFSSGGDPIILYDQEVDRWLITEFPFGFGSSANRLLVGISHTSDPMGEYDVYAFGTFRFPDYPKYGVWSNAYSVTTNEQGAGELHAYFINKEQLLAGENTVTIQRVSLPGNDNTEANFLVATPVDWSGVLAPPEDRDPLILALNDASWNQNQDDDLIEVYSVSIDWENEVNTHFNKLSVPVSPYDSYPCSAAGFGFSCVPQAGGNGLDAIPEILMNQIHYRNFDDYEAMVMNFVTDATDGDNVSGIRWVEMRRTDSTEWEVYQEGTFAPDDGLHRMMGGIAMDGEGNIGLAYNVTSDSTFVGIRFTGRRASDPLGQMTIDETVVIEGTNAINSNGRFGDYGHMTIDPADDKTFWYTTEYAKGGTSYSRILAFKLSKDSIDIGPVTLRSPVTGALLNDDEEVKFTVQNYGFSTLDSFNVGYKLEGETEVVEKVITELKTDETYEHTFARKVDLFELRDYSFKLFTSVDGDQVISNDTTIAVITKLAQRDLRVSIEESILGVNCGGELVAEIRITNKGIDTITEAEISYTLNGFLFAIEEFEGSIPPGKDIVVTQLLTDLLQGENELGVEITNPNGSDDQIPDDNVTTVQFDVNLVGESVTLNLLTDEFPDETSWELLDQDSVVVFSGGPYAEQDNQTLFSETFCLDPEGCYTFIIYDDFGDGFSAYGIDGNYTITNDEGLILASVMNPDFGEQESNSFCVDIMCMIETEINISPDSGLGDGAIIISASNGVAPFQYSIDGGISFQESPGFTNLNSGIYEVMVLDARLCSVEEEIELLNCQGTLSLMLTEPTVADNDGEIIIVFEPVDSTTLYSIDGGSTYSENNMFSGLSSGDYHIIVKDRTGCEYEEMVSFNSTTSITQINEDFKIKIYPNPTEAGVFIEVENLDFRDIFLPITIFNSEGRIIQRKSLTRYDDSYKGMISMYHYPGGTYFIKFHHPEIKVLQKLMRQ